MARIRTIKPEFWRDEKLSSVSAEAALLAVGLLNHSDDEGYFNAHPKLVESDVFPLRTLKVTTTELLRELSGIGYIELFLGSDGKTYGRVVNFAKHQVINKPSPSKIKVFCGIPQDYGSNTVVLPTGKEQGTGNREQGKGKGTGKNAPAARPTDVAESVWDDWVALRKRKNTTVSETVIEGARDEAAKLGWTLEQFLREWCLRGSQGLKASWIKDQPRTYESAKDRSRRETIEALTGRKSHDHSIIDI
jgi:hypothetical protein